MEIFVGDNSIADFMRFRRNDDGDGQLQTAVVSYRKKFPWSLVDPFLRARTFSLAPFLNFSSSWIFIHLLNYQLGIEDS